MKDMSGAVGLAEDARSSDTLQHPRSPWVWGLAAGAVTAFALSLFFPFPLVPVIAGIGLASRIGRSPQPTHGFLYGVAVGPSGFLLRIFVYRPDLAPALWEQAAGLLIAALICGALGIGINKLATGRGSLMW